MYKTNGIIIYVSTIVLGYISYCFGETSNVLVLGGNGMLGSATVLSLLKDSSIKYNVTILNRGNWYWDTEKIIKPYITHIECTRGDGFREDCIQLHNATFDTIIDFSCYDPMDIEDILILMAGRFKRYIYVSSDSVYEVCKVKPEYSTSKEEDAVRPEDETTRLELLQKDDYGNKKLEGEEALERYHRDLNYEYLSLRLPDVLGPRDNTIRFYRYFMWTKMHEILGPIHLPHAVQYRPISFVYSLDVGPLIASLANPNYDSKFFNSAYNLAFRETITLKELVTFIGDWLKHGPTKFDESESAHILHGFPSVSRGPVNITKATTLLNWSPTKLHKALADNCAHYEKMQYDTEYKYVLDRVLDRLGVRGDKYRDFIELHWKKLNDKTDL